MTQPVTQGRRGLVRDGVERVVPRFLLLREEEAHDPRQEDQGRKAHRDL